MTPCDYFPLLQGLGRPQQIQYKESNIGQGVANLKHACSKRDWHDQFLDQKQLATIPDSIATILQLSQPSLCKVSYKLECLAKSLNSWNGDVCDEWSLYLSLSAGRTGSITASIVKVTCQEVVNSKMEKKKKKKHKNLRKTQKMIRNENENDLITWNRMLQASLALSLETLWVTLRAPCVLEVSLTWRILPTTSCKHLKSENMNSSENLQIVERQAPIHCIFDDLKYHCQSHPIALIPPTRVCSLFHLCIWAAIWEISGKGVEQGTTSRDTWQVAGSIMATSPFTHVD